MIPASLCEGHVFYFYVESPSSHFMHQLGEHMIVIPSIMCNVPKYYCLMYVYNVVAPEIIISSHHLSFGGAL